MAPLAYYCGLSFATIYYDECLPLWAVAPRVAGGLAQSAPVGALLSVSGVSLAAFQFVGLPMLSRRGYSSTRILHICTGVAAVVYASTPLLSLVADNEAALATLLALHLSIQKAVVSVLHDHLRRHEQLGGRVGARPPQRVGDGRRLGLQGGGR